MSERLLDEGDRVTLGQKVGGIAFALGLLFACISAPARADSFPDRLSGATGGIFRFPENLQPKNEGNLFGEAWAKLSYELDRTDRAVTSLFALGNFVADSRGFSHNNTAKIGLGLSHSIQVTDALNVTFSARYDWFMERDTDIRRSGIRLAADYYYYKRWEAGPGEKALRLPRIATVFKSYGTLAYPGSLEEGDDNIVLTLGGELSTDLDLPDADWILSPFADFDFSWDKDRNGYNNKIVPGIGVKVRYPLEHGEIFAGIRLSADYRPITGSVETGPTVFLGWYKGF
jgi:hypothetical protein